MAICHWVSRPGDRRSGCASVHLVLCDAFRHPAVLAKQAVTLSDASEGRFDFGLGSGSWPAEFTRFFDWFFRSAGSGGTCSAARSAPVPLISTVLGDGAARDGGGFSCRSGPPDTLVQVAADAHDGLVRNHAIGGILQANHIDRLPKLVQRPEVPGCRCNK